MSTMQEEVIKIARTQVGQKENPIGSNWGGMIENYLNSVVIGSPAPWCAAFAYWCYSKAASNLNSPNPLPVTGYTPLIYRWAEKNELIIESNEAVPGDIILYFHRNVGRIAHCGIVGIVKGNSVWTIEGNTNENGGREGYEVERKYRKINSDIIFVKAMK